MNIPNKQQNAHTSLEWRQTSNVNNDWKVNMYDSTEESANGGSTYNTFWLEHDNGANVTSSHNVQEDSGSHYYAGSEEANGSYVRLTSQNNNYDFNSYVIKGYWDEETD